MQNLRVYLRKEVNLKNQITTDIFTTWLFPDVPSWEDVVRVAGWWNKNGSVVCGADLWRGPGGKKLDRNLEWVRDGDKREKEILTVKNVSRSKDQKHVRHETTDFRHLQMIFRFELRMRRRSGYGNDRARFDSFEGEKFAPIFPILKFFPRVSSVRKLNPPDRDRVGGAVS